MVQHTTPLFSSTKVIFAFFHSSQLNPNFLIFTTGPDDFLEALRKFVSVRSAGSDNSLFMVSDKRTAQLDQSLSELNLVSLLEGDRCAAHKVDVFVLD